MPRTKKITPAGTEVISTQDTTKDIAIISQPQEIVKQEADIDGFLAKRKEFIEQLNQ